MAIEDAHALASALAAARDPAGVAAALGAFERERTAATAREVLFSRHLGRIKQGLSPPCARVQPAERERSGQAAAASADGAGREAPARDGGGHPASGRDGGCGWAAASAAERRALGQANMAKFPVPPHLLQREA